MKHRKDTDELWQEYVGTRSDESRNKLILAYRRLLRYCAQRLKMKLPVCVDQAELESEGVFGLIDAIEKFDPSRGTCFETYCIARIRGSMLDSLRASDWVPRAIRTKAHKLERAKNELAWELDREPTDREIARRMRLKLEEFGNLTKELQVKTQFSLEEPFDSEGSRQRIETMPDRRFPNPLDDPRHSGSYPERASQIQRLNIPPEELRVLIETGIAVVARVSPRTMRRVRGARFFEKGLKGFFSRGSPEGARGFSRYMRELGMVGKTEQFTLVVRL